MAGSNLSNKRQRRGEAIIAGADVFGYLIGRFINARSPSVKERLALELLPYVRLRSVERRVDQQITVEITIGGELPIELSNESSIAELPQ